MVDYLSRYKQKVTLLDPVCRVQQVGEFSEALLKRPPLSHTLPKMFKKHLSHLQEKLVHSLPDLNNAIMRIDTHIYFVPALHLHQNLINSGSWVQMGECTVHVRPSVDKDLYAVILVALEATPCLERRQALKAVANDPVTRMIHDIKLPPEGPVPLISLSQLLRQNTTDWFELYQGRAKRIKCRSLIYDLNAVSVRGDDHEDLIVERLPFAPGSRQHNERTQCFAQFGAFAARDLPACTICASYSRGAMITPTKEVESSLGLRDFDFEVLLGSSSSRLVVTGNPLVNSAAMCNDARGSGREPNAELFVALLVCMDGSRELHVMLQTTEQIKARQICLHLCSLR